MTGDLLKCHICWAAINALKITPNQNWKKLAHHGFTHILQAIQQNFRDVFLVNIDELSLSSTLDPSQNTKYCLEKRSCSDHVARKSVFEAYT